MSTWTRKTVPFYESSTEFEKFDALWQAIGSPLDMLLVKIRDHDRSTNTYFAQLPNEQIVGALPGFEPVCNEELPKTATLLCGHVPEFEKHFQYVR